MYITPDLTIKEREINRALHQELKRRKEAGEKDLIIKRGKIINKQAGSDQLHNLILDWIIIIL